MSKKKLGDRRKEESTLPRVDEDARWDIFIATPAYDGKVDTDYCQSLADASFSAPLFQVNLNCSVMGNGAFIDLARNIFVKIFLEQFPDATHLFFIDSDLKFPANAFIGLARSGLDICAGIYPRRQSPRDFPVKFSRGEDDGLVVTEDGFVMCDRVPTGFLCISRKVIEEMAAEAKQLTIHGQDGPVPQLFYTYIDDEGRFVGEDFAFCDDYRKKYGKDIPVWADIDFVHGGYEGNLAKHMEESLDKHGLITTVDVEAEEEDAA